MRALIFLVVFMTAGPAFAGSPKFAWEEDGTLRATVVFDAPIAEVKAMLSDPYKAVGASPDVKSLEITPKGDCHELTVATPGVRRYFWYTSLRCTTSDGIKDEMISSDDYSAQWSIWKLTDQGDQTLGVLRTHSKLKMWAPKRFVRGGVKRAVRRTIAAMQDLLEK